VCSSGLTFPQRTKWLHRLITASKTQKFRKLILTAVKLTSGDQVELKSTDKNAQVLFISSVLLNEPVAWGGPIVMNTREELKKAFDDLKKGTFIQKTISYFVSEK